MTDIVEMLRRGDPCGDCKRDRCACVIMEDAAEEITALRAENEKLRAALWKIASNNQQRSNCFCGACIQARAARAALEEKP